MSTSKVTSNETCQNREEKYEECGSDLLPIFWLIQNLSFNIQIYQLKNLTELTFWCVFAFGQKDPKVSRLVPAYQECRFLQFSSRPAKEEWWTSKSLQLEEFQFHPIYLFTYSLTLSLIHLLPHSVSAETYWVCQLADCSHRSAGQCWNPGVWASLLHIWGQREFIRLGAQHHL